MFYKLTIKARLGATMAFMAAMLALCGAMGLSGIARSNAALDDVYAVRMPAAIEANLSLARLLRARLVLYRAILHAGTPEAARLIDRAQDLQRASDEAWRRYLALPMESGEKRYADDVAARRAAYLRDGTGAMIAALRAGRRADAEAIMDERMQGLYMALDDSVDRLTRYQSDGAAATYRASRDRYRRFQAWAIGGLTATFAVVVAAFALLARAISQPLERALRHFAAIAAGDLTVPIDVRSECEMGRLMAGLRRMQESLRRTVHDIRHSSGTIAAAAGEIAAGNEELSVRTDQQAGALQETTASMEALTAAVRQNAASARAASALAAAASEAAARGGTAVADVVGTMGAIHDASARIVDIIAVIDGIAFQTNILALNAAVEAARAGAQGRGFAVVAAEVRTLAQRSSAAAREIRALIDDSVHKVDAGKRHVAQAGTIIDGLVDSVRRVDGIVGEIAAASREQSTGIDRIHTAVEEVDLVTQQNAALAEQATAAAAALRGEADGLARLVVAFRVGG
nr:methyl-accepting chemotaxis protein [Massilia sp. JS1662]